MTKPIFKCPNCNNNSTYSEEVVVELVPGNFNKNKHHLIWRCDVCEQLTYKIVDFTKTFQGTYDPPKIDIKEEFQYPYGFLEIEQDLPKTIADFYSEAYNCFKIGSLRASAAMCRATISAICDDFDTKGEDLKERIDKLPLSSRLHEVAKNIKWIGDKTLHNKVDWAEMNWNNGTIEQMITFINTIISDLYTQERKSKELSSIVSKAGSTILKKEGSKNKK